MNVDEYVKFSLSQVDTLILQRVTEVPQPTSQTTPRTLKKMRLEQLPLSETTSAMMQAVEKMRDSQPNRQRVLDQNSFKNGYKRVITDPLFKNSIFNMVSTFILGGLGFVFWIIIARLYKAESV